MTVMFIEVQWDSEASVIRMEATTGFGPQHDTYRVTRPAPDVETAVAEANSFARMYRDLGVKVVT